jgi:beta-alanine degradation protein BauB
MKKFHSRRQILALITGLLAEPGVASAQDAAKIDPHSYRVVLENDKVRVLEYVSLPGYGICGAGQHFHPGHVTVQMTPAKVRLTDKDGKVSVLNAPPGTVFWEDAVVHTTENIGGFNARAFIVEIKDANWKPSTG